MKNLIFILQLSIFTFSIIGISQETTFKVSKENITPFVVTTCKGKSEKEIYTKTLEWVSRTFKNKDEVIQSKIENELVRIQGYSKNINGTLDAIYVINIEFKDGKYKFEPIQLELTNDQINKFDFLKTYPTYFKKDGSVKSRLKDTVTSVENLLNDLNISLFNYIMDNKKKRDW